MNTVTWRNSSGRLLPPRTAEAVKLALRYSSANCNSRYEIVDRVIEDIADEIENNTSSFDSAIAVYKKHVERVKRSGRPDIGEILIDHLPNFESIQRRPLGTTASSLARAFKTHLN